MKDIKQDFVQEYLATHHKFLDSIYGFTMPNPDISISAKIIKEFKHNTNNDQEKSLQSLRNAWYHECSFLYQYRDKYEWAFWF